MQSYGGKSSWSALKEKILQFSPEFLGMPKNIAAIRNVCESAVEAWEEADDTIKRISISSTDMSKLRQVLS